MTLVVGGFFRFPVTEPRIRVAGGRGELSAENTLRLLGTQVASVLPISLPVRVPVAMYASSSISVGAWYTGAALVRFDGVDRALISRETRETRSP